MGTASTMATMTEALGVSLPGNAALPAVDAGRARMAHLVGRRAVAMVREDLRLSRILTPAAFANAIRVNGAAGGSTNAVIHLLAIAGRIGVDLSLDDWDRLGRDVPCLLDLMPSGRFLMEDFCYAGGVPALMSRITDLLELGALTVTGETVAENLRGASVFDDAVIRPRENPLTLQGGIAVLRGNLAPGGAIIKPSAATAALMRHTGAAVVFETIEDYKARIDSPDLPVDENSVLVLKNCGPIGYPGMAEVGNMPLPQRLLQRGVRDMVRISDARMSGTAYGTVVLHAVPEAAAGGTFALVADGDTITLDVAARLLHLDVTDDELTRRRTAWRPTVTRAGGYQKMYIEHVLQADRGADLDFLVGCRGAAVPRESH